MRRKVGDALEILTAAGAVWLATIVDGDGGIQFERVLCAPRPPARGVVLYQALLKGDRFSEVVDRGTQAGVSRFVPLVTARTIVRDVSPSKWQRWQTIAKEASEQCGRAEIPTIGPLVRLAEVELNAEERGFVLHPDAPYARPWLEADSAPVALVVGPEGGLNAFEVQQLTQKGFLPLSLGPRVFRAENAGMVAAVLFLQ